MTLIKVYNTATGNVQTVRELNWPEKVHAVEVETAQALCTRFAKEDKNTDHAYYVSEGA